MNKRKLQKMKTRELILETAKKEFIKRGFLNTTTSQIAQSAGIAHGTLFLHFNNKNILIVKILDNELDQISASIQKLVSEAADLEQMLILYLNMIQEDEDLFSVLARELPFYPEELRRMILFRDSIIRNHFHKVIMAGIKSGEYRPINVTSVLSFLFGTINYYLSLKTIFVKNNSVIEKFKTSIISTFKTLVLYEKGA